MKPILLIVTLLFAVTFTKAQNLVPNGNFEQYSICPNSISQVFNCTGWTSYTSTTPDYFHTCASVQVGIPTNFAGYESPASGNAYIGIVAYSNNREYVTSQITPMQIGTSYEISMSISQSDLYNTVSTNNVGILLYDSGPTFLTSTAALTNIVQGDFRSYGAINNQNGWTRVSTIFQADSAYDNIAIGGFFPNSSINVIGNGNLTYYYIDSVVIKKYLKISTIITDTVYCAGDTISVPFTIFPSNAFTLGNVFSLQLSNAAGSFASPTIIGSLTGSTAGTITGIIPATMPAGAGYRVRIASSLPNGWGDASKEIKISPILAAFASNNSPICAGSNLNMDAATPTGSTYSWQGPSSFSSTLKNPTITNASLSAAGNYVVTATFEGCISKDTIAVMVNSVPAKPVVGNNGPLCNMATLMLTALSDTPSVSYSWAGPSFTSNTQNPIISNATPANSGLYTVTATKNNCTSPAESTTVLVHPQTPKPVAASNSPICAGEALILSATGTAGAIFNWKGMNSFSSTQQNPVINPALAYHGGIYELTATLNGCVSEPDTEIVVILPAPVIGGYASPNDTVCKGTLVTFVAVAQYAGATPLYQWYKNYNAIPNANTSLYSTANLVTGDVVYCTMNSTGACVTNFTVSTDTIEMAVFEVVTMPSATLTSVPAIPVPGQLVTFTAHPQNGGPNPKYQWQVNGVNIIGAVYATWSAAQLYHYDKINCIITSDDPCANIKVASSDTVIVNFPTGVNDLNQKQSLSLYPNPNNGNFSLQGFVESDKPLTIEVTNSIGQVVYTDIYNSVSKQLNVQVTTNKPLPHGVYMLTIKNSEVLHHIPFTIAQ